MGSARRAALLVAFGLLAGVALTSCSTGPAGGLPWHSSDWGAAPKHTDGLSMLAAADATGFRLYTRSGEKRFLPGINLGSTTPLHQPGEVGTIPQTDYRRWFAEMGRMGIRVIRIYTLPSPGMYVELARYNRSHPRTPLYLMQGVYLPDESYTRTDRTLYTPAVDRAFTQELLDVSDAVHGNLVRDARPGRAGGSYRTDVSPWLLGWIVGVEWDTPSVLRTDRRMRATAYRPGKYFAATANATATERWLARHMDTLATREHGYGDTEPIAFVNWPTADPLPHPDEPLPSEDITGVDANHVLATKAWPGGTFASFHAYPYYPDFQRHTSAYRKTSYRGRPDPYAGYIAALKSHFAGHMPLLITETGVPGSLGSAHFGPLGRDQGHHTEQQQLAIDADLLRLLQAQGVSAGFLFEWTDEWFKRTWNTQEHQLDGTSRRQLWHDPMTNEQWFGVVATDSGKVVDSGHELVNQGPVKYALATADASWLHLDVTPSGPMPKRFTLSVNTVPGPEKADYKIVVDVARGSAQAYVRAGLDPIRLDFRVPHYAPDAGKAWHRYMLIVDRTLRLHGRVLAAQYFNVGRLVEGSSDPASKDYNSLATWRVDTKYRTLRLRIPWPMLGLSDPSARQGLGAGNPAQPVTIPGLGLTLNLDGKTASMRYLWPPWNFLSSRERTKAGAYVLVHTFHDLAP
ncbi:MAG: hypothetical protein M3Z50_03105 [Actinomycetota bacterium]|nr:hypothetical protein [Actinomycetota bacterium]